MYIGIGTLLVIIIILLADLPAVASTMASPTVDSVGLRESREAGVRE